MKKYLLGASLTAAAFAVAMPAQAAITIEGVTATNTADNSDPVKMIDGSGLDGALHGSRNRDKWFTANEAGNDTSVITFDFGSLYDLTSMSIWNFGGTCCDKRNVNELEASISTDGVSYSTIGTFSLTNVTDADVPADMFSISGIARFVQFDILSNQGAPNVGLSEVQFDGQAVGVVPEPATWAFLISGFGLVGGAMRRRRKVSAKISFA